MMRQHLAILADNKPGVLTHVAGLISRRAINIECINAGYTEEPDVTRINIVVSVENRWELDQAVNQLAKLIDEKGIARDDTRIFFAQLLGMSDNISFNLAHEGYNVTKYVPYARVRDVLPYLIRRAEENTSVAGQTGRELRMLKTELDRRKRAK